MSATASTAHGIRSGTAIATEVEPQLVMTSSEGKGVVRGVLDVFTSFTLNEWFVGLGAAVTLYLVNGTYAPLVCAILTGLPGVLLSYRVVVNTVDIGIYQLLVIYWILYGLLTMSDHIVGKAFCYYTVKFVFMTAVYAYVSAQTRKPSTRSAAVPATGSGYKSRIWMAQSLDTLSTSQTQLPSRAPPVTAKNSSLMNYLLRRQVKTISPPTTYTGLNELDTIPTALPICDRPEKVNETSGNMDADAEIVSNIGEISPIAGQMRNLFHNFQTDRRTVAGKDCSTTVGITDCDRMISSPKPLPSTPILGLRDRCPSDSGDVVTGQTLPLFDKDIDASPAHALIFHAPFGEFINLRLTNVTKDRLMWALKTNAAKRIIATPTCGFMDPGQHIAVTFAVSEGAIITPYEASNKDRLAIDYRFVAPDQKVFDPSMVSSNRLCRRKAFAVRYVL